MKRQMASLNAKTQRRRAAIRLLASGFWLLASALFAGVGQSRLPIQNGYLLGNLNGNRQYITNLAGLTDTNGNPISGGSATNAIANLNGLGTNTALTNAVLNGNTTGGAGSTLQVGDIGSPQPINNIAATNVSATNFLVTQHGGISWPQDGFFIGASNNVFVLSSIFNEFTCGSSPGATDGNFFANNFFGGTFHGSGLNLTNIQSTNITRIFNTNVLTGAQMYDGAGNLGGTNLIPVTWTNSYVPPYINTNVCITNGTLAMMELGSNIYEVELILNNTNTMQTYDLSFAAYPNVGLLGGLTNHYKMVPNTITDLHLKYVGTNYQSSNTFFAWVTGSGSGGGGGGSQTPWTSDIDGGQHQLTNVIQLAVTNVAHSDGLTIGYDSLVTGTMTLSDGPNPISIHAQQFLFWDNSGNQVLSLPGLGGTGVLSESLEAGQNPNTGTYPALSKFLSMSASNFFVPLTGSGLGPDINLKRYTNFQGSSFSFTAPVHVPASGGEVAIIVSNTSGGAITATPLTTWSNNWQTGGGTASIGANGIMKFDVSVIPGLYTNISWTSASSGSGTVTSGDGVTIVTNAYGVASTATNIVHASITTTSGAGFIGSASALTNLVTVIRGQFNNNFGSGGTFLNMYGGRQEGNELAAEVSFPQGGYFTNFSVRVPGALTSGQNATMTLVTNTVASGIVATLAGSGNYGIANDLTHGTRHLAPNSTNSIEWLTILGTPGSMTISWSIEFVQDGL